MNIPTVTEDNFAFGPGILKLGVAGATPTVDIGSITEDGISIEITSEKRDITQGNPKLPVYTFSQAQGVTISATGIEWSFDNFANALGAGTTTEDVAADTFAFGGDPLVSQVAIQVEHVMAVTGHTLTVNVWKAVSNGGLTLPLTHDEHQFEYSWKALRSVTDWAGGSLDYKSQLIGITRQKT
jgi:hypothetical protein